MVTLTNARKKLLSSLATPKGRRLTGFFMAQGSKCVLDTLPFFQVEAIYATSEWSTAHPEIPAEVIARADIKDFSTLSTCPDVVAIYHIPQPITEIPVQGNLYLALDCVQDPGNLGTIMRVADWMGVHTIFASKDTADVWNPKVVQATMGAIARVNIRYVDNLPSFLETSGLPIFATALNGENIYSTRLPSSAIIVMGNEGSGISSETASVAKHKLLIPSYPPGEPTSESLNVAVATAITLSEFRRQQTSETINKNI